MISISPFRFEGNKLVIDPEILVYKSFRDVYDIDKDTKKELALSYFIYIYHCADQKAVPIIKGHSKKDTHEYACKEANLQITFKPDIRIITAIEFYKDNFISPVKELQLNLLNTLQKNIKILTRVDDIVDTKLGDENITPEGLSILMDLQKKCSTMAEQLTDQIKTLKNLDKLIAEDSDNKSLGRGGFIIEDSMTGNSPIED